MVETPYQRLSLFLGLNKEHATLLKTIFTTLEIPAETVLFEQGDPAKLIYLVAKGEVQIFHKPDDGPAINLARVRANGVVGWSAVLGNVAYTSTAVCVSDCTLVHAGGEALRGLCLEYPSLGVLVLERLAEGIADRLRIAQPQVLALLEQGLQLNGIKLVFPR